MREEQFIRFVEQICFLLKLSQPCSKTALQYFLEFKEYEGHNFEHQIQIGACIYLSVKIFEEEVRIRDILNMIYVLTSLYKISQKEAIKLNQNLIKEESMQNNIRNKQIQQNKILLFDKESSKKQEQIKIERQDNHQCQFMIQQKQSIKNIKKIQQFSQSQQQPYVLLKKIQKLEYLQDVIQPTYSLSDYNEYKGKIIQAQQTLLRILGFNFSLSQQNKNQLKRLLITMHHMRMPPTIAETTLKVYNDIHYIDINYWPEGIIYYSFLLVKIFVQQKLKSAENLDLKEDISESLQHKKSQRETLQVERINQFTKIMNSKKWEELFSTKIKDLQNYAEKLTNFYLAIKFNQ